MEYRRELQHAMLQQCTRLRSGRLGHLNLGWVCIGTNFTMAGRLQSMFALGLMYTYCTVGYFNTLYYISTQV